MLIEFVCYLRLLKLVGPHKVPESPPCSLMRERNICRTVQASRGEHEKKERNNIQ